MADKPATQRDLIVIAMFIAALLLPFIYLVGRDMRALKTMPCRTTEVTK